MQTSTKKLTSSRRIAMHGVNEFDLLSLLSDPGTSQSPLLGERLTFKSPLNDERVGQERGG